jgi:hypothetical protein
MKARRATPDDNAILREVVMHPALRRRNAHDGAPAFEPAAYTAHSHSFAVIVEHDAGGVAGCFLASAIEERAYGVHTNLLPTCRGAKGMEAAAAALEFAFLRTDAEQLVSMVPDSNAQALWFAHAMGFKDTYRCKEQWPQDGTRYDVQYLAMHIDEWICRLTTCELGERFHEVLRSKGAHIDHAPNHVHDAYVGAAWAMTAAGLLGKGVRVYGRWARATSFQPYVILSQAPLRIDIGTCVLRAENDEFLVEETAARGTAVH